MTTRRICKSALLLASLCLIGMFSIPLGANIKVSLQLLVVFVLCLIADGVVDVLLITGCYLLMGLFLPIYAGFSAGITPTFGFVIGFVVAAPGIYCFNRFVRLPSILRMVLACLAGLLVVYLIGTIFMMLYLDWGLGKTLLVSVVPYLAFDGAKIALAVVIAKALPLSVVHCK